MTVALPPTADQRHLSQNWVRPDAGISNGVHTGRGHEVTRTVDDLWRRHVTLLHVCSPDYSLPTSSLQHSQGSVKAPFHGSDLSGRQEERWGRNLAPSWWHVFCSRWGRTMSETVHYKHMYQKHVASGTQWAIR